VPLYCVPPATVRSAAAGQAGPPVSCRRCPGGYSRGTRSCCYPSDMDDREWAVCEPLLPARRGWRVRAAARRRTACAMSWTASGT
jgi:hypothetical protein